MLSDKRRAVLIDRTASALGEGHVPLFFHRRPGFEERAAGRSSKRRRRRIMTFRFGFKMQAADDFLLLFAIPIIAGFGRKLIDDRRLRQTSALALKMNIRLVVQDRFDLIHVALGVDLVIFNRRQDQRRIRQPFH